MEIVRIWWDIPYRMIPAWSMGWCLAKAPGTGQDRLPCLGRGKNPTVIMTQALNCVAGDVQTHTLQVLASSNTERCGWKRRHPRYTHPSLQQYCKVVAGGSTAVTIHAPASSNTLKTNYQVPETSQIRVNILVANLQNLSCEYIL